MSKKKSEWYLSSEDIYNEWKVWKDTGVMTNKLGE